MNYIDILSKLEIIEYSCKQKCFHTESLMGRLKKNYRQILYNGKPTNPDYVPIAICPEDEVCAAMDEFEKLLESENKRRKMRKI